MIRVMAESMTPVDALERLEELRFSFGRDPARAKLAALERLADGFLSDADEVERLHDVLLVLRAYPDDRRILDRVTGLLDGFAAREDTVDLGDDLVNTGIAGTEIHFSFYWFTLCWLIRHWPHQVRIDWSAFGTPRQLSHELPTPSPSTSVWSGLNWVAQLSHASPGPSPSVSD